MNAVLNLDPQTLFASLLGLSFLISVLLTPLVGRLATHFGVVAAPRRDRWHTSPTPLLGGAAIFAGTIIALLFLSTQDLRLLAVLGGATMLFIMGLFDDVLHLRPHTKLLVQIGAACVLLIGGVQVESATTPLVAIPLTIFWVVGLTNAFNLLDNMDGLAAGIGTITALVLFVMSLGSGNQATALLALSIAGACLGFLVYNFNPARIFMGDSGSMFIGFLLSAITLLGTREMASDVVLTMLVPVAIMGLPIFDTTLVTVMRSVSGRSITQGGRDHISHRLVALGLSERQTALVLYLIAAAFGGLAILSRWIGFWPTVGLAATMVAATAVFGAFLGQVRIYSEETLRDQEGRDPGSVRTTIGSMLMYKREVALVLLDALLIGAAYVGAYLLKYGFDVQAQSLTPSGLSGPWPQQFGESLPYLIIIKLAALVATRAYRGIWRYAGVRDLLDAVKATTLGTLGVAILLPLLVPDRIFPRSLLVIDWLLLTTLLIGSRASFVVLADFFNRLHRVMAPRVLIVGAGDVGEMVLRFMLRTGPRTYQPLGFLDDDPAKLRRAIHGVRVLGTTAELPDVIARLQPSLVVVALPPNLQARDRVLLYCQEHDIPYHDAASFLASELSVVPMVPNPN